jgi:hypothetical protein
MNRIFGRPKPQLPAVNIGDVNAKVDGRVTDLDMKVLPHVSKWLNHYCR